MTAQQAALFAPAEIRQAISKRRARDADLPMPTPVLTERPGRQVFIVQLSGDTDVAGMPCHAGSRTLYGPALADAIAAVLDARPTAAKVCPASAVRVEDGEKHTGAADTLAFLAPAAGGRLQPFALVEGLTLAEARAELGRAA